MKSGSDPLSIHIEQTLLSGIGFINNFCPFCTLVLGCGLSMVLTS